MLNLGSSRMPSPLNGSFGCAIRLWGSCREGTTRDSFGLLWAGFPPHTMTTAASSDSVSDGRELLNTFYIAINIENILYGWSPDA